MPFQKFRDYYFAEKNYTLIYLHRMFFRSGNQLIAGFTGAYLFHLGFTITQIMMFFACKFFVQGFAAIFCNDAIKKIGVPKGIFITLIFFCLSYFLMARIDQSFSSAIPALIAHAIASGMYFSFADVMEAMYISYDRHRGKQFLFGAVITSLVGTIGVAITGYILAFSTYYYAALFSSLCVLLSAVPVFFLKSQTDTIHRNNTKRVFALMRSKPFRPFIFTFFGEQLYIMGRTVFIPLFVFLIVDQKFSTFGLLMVAASLVEIVATLIFGHYIDKSGNRVAIRKSFWISVLTSLSYIFIVTGPLSAFLNESLQRICNNSFMGAFRTGLHKRIRNKFELMTFGAAWQSVSCFSSTFSLIMLASIVPLVGTHIFTVVFVTRVLGVHICSRFLHNNPHVKQQESKETNK